MRRSTLSASQRDEQSAFLRSIQETPDDDAPRLVYADWLDDLGDPDRADFIRTQCRLETLPRNAPQRQALRNREADLLRRNKSEWLGPWDSRSNEATFRRGFLDVFRVGPNFALGLGAVAAALSPYHDLTRTFAFQSNRLAESLVPLLGGTLPCLRRLECENCVGGNALVEAMAAWPSGLAELVLRRCLVGSPGVAALARAPWLTQLRSLDLRDNHVGHDALTSLLLCPGLRGLEGLAITGSEYLTGHALVPLLSGHLTSLRRLRVQPGVSNVPGLLEPGGFGDEGLSLLAREPALGRFTSLEFISQGIGDDGVEALAASPHARGLTTLNLRGNLFGEAGVVALATSPSMANLTSLDLLANPNPGQDLCGGTGVRRLAESPYLRNLVTLRLLVSSAESEAVVEPLLEPGRLPALRDLVMNVTRTEKVLERFRARGVELTSFYAGD